MIEETELVWLIKEGLLKLNDPCIKRITADNDHKSGEVIIEMKGGMEYIIRTNDILLQETDEEEE